MSEERAPAPRCSYVCRSLHFAITPPAGKEEFEPRPLDTPAAGCSFLSRTLTMTLTLTFTYDPPSPCSKSIKWGKQRLPGSCQRDVQRAGDKGCKQGSESTGHRWCHHPALGPALPDRPSSISGCTRAEAPALHGQVPVPSSCFCQNVVR